MTQFIHLWRAQLHLAMRTPWLATTWLARSRAWLARLVHRSTDHGRLPHRVPRHLQRQLRSSLAGAALALALVHTPAQAADFTVNDATTLVAAIDNANDETAYPGADTITLLTDITLTTVNNSGLNGPNGLPVIDSAITIEGNGATIARSGVSETPDFRLFEVSATGALTLSNTTITNGALGYALSVAQDDGGGIYNSGITTVISSTISDNHVDGNGGAIYSYNGTVTLIDSIITGNSSGDAGGGIYSQSQQGAAAVVDLINTLVSNNNAVGYGGGIVSQAGDDSVAHLTVERSVISGNQSAEAGGGIANDAAPGGTATVGVTNSAIRDNGATIGGGLNNYAAPSGSATTSVISSTISGNTAQEFGGGIYNENGTVDIIGSTISGNRAEGSYFGGGGLYNYAVLGPATVTMTNSTISGNQASDNGGGIANYGTPDHVATLRLLNTTVTGNSAGDRGGGIFNAAENSVVHLNRSLISGNMARDGGNELYNVVGNTIHTDAYNLFGDESQSTADALANVSVGDSDITATSDGSAPTASTAIYDPTLADNGGPLAGTNDEPLLTHALIAGSPALDAAGDSGLDVDQRGVARPQGTADDIGALEAAIPLALDDSYSTERDTTLVVDAASGVLGNDRDPLGNTLTALLASDVSSGTLTLNSDGSFTYIPDATFSGNDRFTYRADNGTLPSTEAVVDITVNALSLAAGDCNGDESTNAGDLTATVLEIFDGDGNLADNAPTGSFAGTSACDSNDDTLIDAGDLACTVLTIFNGPGACDIP